MRPCKVFKDYTHRELLFEAKFHEFGSDYEVFENGAANYTVAVVEKKDGYIECVYPQCIKFTDTEPVEGVPF